MLSDLVDLSKSSDYESQGFTLVSTFLRNYHRVIIDLNILRNENMSISTSDKIVFVDYVYRIFYDIFSMSCSDLKILNKKPSQFIHQKSNALYHNDDHIIITVDIENYTIERLKPLIDSLITHIKNNRLAYEVYLKQVGDQNVLRSLVCKEGLAFIADGSILARTDRVTDKPLPSAVPFLSPSSLVREFDLPHTGIVRGMLLPRGVSVITGGGFHGKSTLLRALATGVMNKVPGDGREFVVIDPSAVCIRAEDGRYVDGVDVSIFIGTLPSIVNINPRHFCTSSASGSTSQAANIMEAIEAGVKALLLDEDTCAANFMVRDSRMRSMVASEPITPFIYRVNSMWLQHGVSTVVVIGGCGDWFDVQDTTLLLSDYVCHDATKKAASISRTFSHGRVQYNGRGLVHQLPWSWTHLCLDRFPVVPFRIRPRPRFDAVNGQVANFSNNSNDEGSWFPLHVSDEGFTISFGPLSVDLSRVDILDCSEPLARGIGLALLWIWLKVQESAVPLTPTSALAPAPTGDCIHAKSDKLVSELSISALLDRLEAAMDEFGLVCLTSLAEDIDSSVAAYISHNCSVVRPRRLDVAMALNRTRGMSFVYKADSSL